MKVGWIGFGEAASSITSGLIAEGLSDICAYDAMADHTDFGKRIHQRAEEVGVEIVPTLGALIKQSNLVICATSAKYAKQIATDAGSYLTEAHVYVDINAASPMVKTDIAEIMMASGVKFVDVAVMESIPKYKHKVPMLVSGTGVSEFVAFGKTFGMNVTDVGRQAGKASAIKMARSTFMKGITMLFFETLQLANKYQAEDIIMDSLNETLTQKPLKETANVLITRTANHAMRRVAEMDEVHQTLKTFGLDSVMTDATKLKLQQLAGLGLNEYFNFKTPRHYSDVLAALNQIAANE